MPRLTPQQLLAARRAKRESLGNSLIKGILGTEQDLKEAIDDIDNVMFTAVEAALWHWFYEILPRHFGPGATKKYGYPDRSKGYMVGKYIGRAGGAGGRSRWRFPKATAYKMAGWTGPASSGERAPDPHPLQLSGTFKTRVTAGPVGRGIRVTRVRDGYRGVLPLATAPYIRAEDLDALRRYNDADLAAMFDVIDVVVSSAFGTATAARRVAYGG